MIMQTYTGNYFDFTHSELHNFNVIDIAHHLSLVNRFNGATMVPYSVAQHSVHVSHLVPEEYAMYGLMHDASEAYLGDVIAPLKHLLPEYMVLEMTVQNAVWRWLGLKPVVPYRVHLADLTALATERRDLLLDNPDPRGNWQHLGKPDEVEIVPLPAKKAEHLFLTRFTEIVLS